MKSLENSPQGGVFPYKGLFGMKGVLIRVDYGDLIKSNVFYNPFGIGKMIHGIPVNLILEDLKKAPKGMGIRAKIITDPHNPGGFAVVYSISPDNLRTFYVPTSKQTKERANIFFLLSLISVGMLGCVSCSLLSQLSQLAQR